MGPGTADYQMVRLDGILVGGWYGDVTDEGVATWRKSVAEVAQRTQGPIGLITCIRESSSPPDGELRRSAAKILFDPSVAVSLLVFEGTGFRAAIVRSVIAMMFALVGNKNAVHKVIGDPKEAAQWFVEHTAGQPWRPDSGEILRIIEALLTTT